MKQKLLISFSGGRTSAFMTNWLLENLSDKYEMKVVFANTGKEREETLEFVRDCDCYFGFNTVWVEADIQHKYRVGTKHKIINFETANRSGGPFEEMIKKYGIPNVSYPHCTRELKTAPIHHYIKSLGWTQYDSTYFTAIGIRIDEVDRISDKWRENKLMYPLIQMLPTKQTDINKFWLDQDFDLRLKSYEGNCDLCFKKSEPKLLTILKENIQFSDWWEEMERKYQNYVPRSRDITKANLPIRFYRGNKSILELLKLSQDTFKDAEDISQMTEMYIQSELFNPLDLYEWGCGETCEPFK